MDPSKALSLMPQHGGEEWSPHGPSGQNRAAMVSDHGLPLHLHWSLLGQSQVTVL